MIATAPMARAVAARVGVGCAPVAIDAIVAARLAAG